MVVWARMIMSNSSNSRRFSIGVIPSQRLHHPLIFHFGIKTLNALYKTSESVLMRICLMRNRPACLIANIALWISAAVSVASFWVACLTWLLKMVDKNWSISFKFKFSCQWFNIQCVIIRIDFSECLIWWTNFIDSWIVLYFFFTIKQIVEKVYIYCGLSWPQWTPCTAEAPGLSDFNQDPSIKTSWYLSKLPSKFCRLIDQVSIFVLNFTRDQTAMAFVCNRSVFCGMQIFHRNVYWTV